MEKQEKIDKYVNSNTFPIKDILSSHYEIDYYQRGYVWGKEQIEDLVFDLTSSFLSCYKEDDEPIAVKNYDPYFMGEIILSTSKGNSKIIDGQQRLTSLTLLFIWLIHRFDKDKKVEKLLSDFVYADNFASQDFRLNIPERKKCMEELLNNGAYVSTDKDGESVVNIVNRYVNIGDVFPQQVADDKQTLNKIINENNIIHFLYWLTERVFFSKVEALRGIKKIMSKGLMIVLPNFAKLKQRQPKILYLGFFYRNLLMIIMKKAKRATYRG